MTQKNKIIIFVLFAIALCVISVFLWRASPLIRDTVTFLERPKVIDETLEIPETKLVSNTAGRTPLAGHYAVPLVPEREGEKVVVTGAVLTLKESFGVALPKAEAWAKDAKLVFVASQGTVTLEGKSGMWQVVFGSLSKKKGYEVIVQGDRVVSEKELSSQEYGYNLPVDWYDAVEAIRSLQSLPQFVDATVSSINFFYNRDGKRWGYALSTSRGTTSMSVR